MYSTPILPSGFQLNTAGSTMPVPLLTVSWWEKKNASAVAANGLITFPTALEVVCLAYRNQETNLPFSPQTAAQSNLTIIIIILIILVFLITIFSLIVYLSIKFHTKKIHRKLEVTKSELEATALNKQISQDYYTDIGLETIYEDCKEVYAIPSYSDDCARYESGPRGIGLEPEYLTMTEGFPLPPLPVRQPETVEYSNLWPPICIAFVICNRFVINVVMSTCVSVCSEKKPPSIKPTTTTTT